MGTRSYTLLLNVDGVLKVFSINSTLGNVLGNIKMYEENEMQTHSHLQYSVANCRKMTKELEERHKFISSNELWRLLPLPTVGPWMTGV